MNGLMMDSPLLLKTLLWRAERVFTENEIVTAVDDGLHRYTYGEYAVRVRRLAAALRSLGVGEGDRVGTLAWNHWRHFEAYYGVPCLGAVLHTINLRLFPDQIVDTINRAGDKVLLVDVDQLGTVEALWPQLQHVETIVVLAEEVADSGLPTIGYEAMLADATPLADFPDLDERTAGALCFTSATTGAPATGQTGSRDPWAPERDRFPLRPSGFDSFPSAPAYVACRTTVLLWSVPQSRQRSRNLRTPKRRSSGQLQL